MSDPLLDHFKSQWQFARGLTLDLLDALSGEELLLSPHGSLGPWWKQFRHVGRVQENYIAAAKTGRVNFGIEGCAYRGGADKSTLRKYLENLDSQGLRLIETTPPDTSIDWFGEQKSLAQHLLYLVDHEILHHGQWVVYRKELGGGFPKSWSAWGL